MQNLLLVTTYAQKVLFYSVIKKIEIFHFPVVKMAANYAKINRVGSLGACFQKVPHVQNF